MAVEPPEAGSAGGRARELLPNLVLLVSAVAATLLTLEIGVRLFVDLREFRAIAVHGVDPDNPIAFLPGHQRVYETREFRYTVSFNRFGRRDVEWTPETIADPRNVLFIGDSFVLGNGVDHEWTVPSLLERHLSHGGEPLEVFNFGMPAGAPPTYLRLLEHALEAGFAARTVVVGLFVGNDFYPGVLPELQRAAESRPREPARRRLPRSKLLRFLELRVSQSPLLVGWGLRLGGMLGISLYDTAGSYIFLRNPTREQAGVFGDILRYVGRMQRLCSSHSRCLRYVGRMQRLCEEHDRELRVVVFPNRIQVENHEALTNAVFDAGRPNRRILEYCELREVVCLDLLPVLRRRYETTRDPLYFPIDRHLNELGTQAAAQAVAAFLSRSAAADGA